MNELNGFRPLRREAIPDNDGQLRGDNRLLGDSMSNRQVCHGGQNEQREWHYPGDGGEKQRDGAFRRAGDGGRDDRVC